MNDLFTLKDKVVVVTGAGGLLGFEYCKAIINARGTPILIDINEELLKSKVEELKIEFPKCVCDSYIVDITKDRANVKMTLVANGKVCATGEGLFVAVKEDHPAYHRWN